MQKFTTIIAINIVFYIFALCESGAAKYERTPRWNIKDDLVGPYYLLAYPCMEIKTALWSNSSDCILLSFHLNRQTNKNYNF